ncbi:MAG: segregation/condensation protein A [Candidatus Aenigmarchaeota archaeon]|nr:segregation/condensation protein A [Candidatus Aenigmarchaeota archaeon]
MDEKEIMDLITSEYSWEQIIYKIIAWEGMDPWNLDLSLLSRSFLLYMNRMKELDFKIPAKYVVIAAVLLRMKSDHIEYLKMLTQGQEELGLLEEGADPGMENTMPETVNGEINMALASLNVNVPSKRQPTRKVVAAELMAALRNALRTDERRSERSARRRGQIVINEENITERIELLYKKINSLLERLKEEEIEFSKLVKKWSREEILNTFVPLVYLDHEKKVHCRQEDLFKEIYIKKLPEGQAAPGKTMPEAKPDKVKTKKINPRKVKRK